ncbi:hypothetical protein ACFE04_008405 [Oxalis oulophora]
MEKKTTTTTTYCVTGATGYIGSYLVKTLLQRGYNVHATVRHPAKALHLLPVWNGGDRLSLYTADLQKEGSFDEAVKDCDGVFHVAAPMQFNLTEEHENIDTYVQSNFVKPAIEGTLNLLKACLKSQSVKRVIFTSSISTMTAKDSNGKWKPVVDESCQTSVDVVRKIRASGWVYVLTKLLTEEAAFRFATDNGIDLVSIITTTVSGPFLTQSVPSSIQVLISQLTGDPRFFTILSAVSNRMGSIALVHIEDICNAHIFLMEHPKATGRYICSSLSCTINDLADHLGREYPSACIQKFQGEKQEKIPLEISSRKLKDLGFVYKYGIEDIIRQTIKCCVDHGFLPFLDVVHDKTREP